MFEVRRAFRRLGPPVKLMTVEAARVAMLAESRPQERVDLPQSLLTVLMPHLKVVHFLQSVKESVHQGAERPLPPQLLNSRQTQQLLLMLPRNLTCLP